MNSYTVFPAKIKAMAAASVLFLTALVFGSCSSSYNDEDAGWPDKYDNHSKRNVTFYDDGVKWKVKLEAGHIAELYRNNEMVPPDEIRQYKDYIYNTLDEIDNARDEYNSEMNEYNFDKEKFGAEMREMRKKLKDENFDIKFNDEEFREKLEEMSDKLKETFDSEEFKKNMAELKENLKSHSQAHTNIHIPKIHIPPVNVPEFTMPEIVIPEIDVPDMDFSGLEHSMSNFNKGIHSDNGRLTSFKKFMNDLKNKFEEDGLINSTNENFDMDFNARELYINGKKVPDNLFQKYKAMYEERFGKMDDDMSIRR